MSEDNEEAPRELHDHVHEPEVCHTLDCLIITKEEGTSDEQFEKEKAKAIAEYNPYFAIFVKPVTGGKEGNKYVVCFHCGEPLTGLMSVLMGKGGFAWGLAHGEGFCRNCKWPIRGHHFAKDKDGNEIFTLHNIPLQYLPKYVVEGNVNDKST